MKKVLTVLMLLALINIEATAQLNNNCGLIKPVAYSQDLQGCVKMSRIKTMDGLGFTPVVLNDTDNILDVNPIVYVQSDFVTHLERDSSRNYTALGYYQVLDRWAAHGDTITLNKNNYFTGQIINLLSVVTTNDSTRVVTTAGTINGATSYLWTQASTGTYKHISILFDGTNYFIR
jgi:hypothetical protein